MVDINKADELLLELLFLGMFKPHHTDGTRACVEPSDITNKFTLKEFSQFLDETLRPLEKRGDPRLVVMLDYINVGVEYVQREYLTQGSQQSVAGNPTTHYHTPKNI